MRPWGTTLAGVVAAAAARYPDRVAVHDDVGSTTYRELWSRVQLIAGGLATRGVDADARVGLLCRNHRGFVESLVAVSATGADVVLLNTGFAGPQLADVVEQEDIGFVIHDDEFADLVSACGARASTSPPWTSCPRSRNGSGHDAPRGGWSSSRPARREGRRVRLGATIRRRSSASRPCSSNSVPSRRHAGDRGSPVPRMGAHEPAARFRPLHHQRARPTIRCRAHPARHHEPRGRSPRRGSHDAVADPRPPPEVLVSAPTHSPPCHRIERLGSREQAGRERPRSLRSRPLQHLRLDRSGDRVCLDRPRAARRPPPPGAERSGRGVEDPRRVWGAPALVICRSSVRRRLDAVRGLYDRGREGGDPWSSLIG